jgi:protein involved in polysaccharide export with SLBB domain
MMKSMQIHIRRTVLAAGLGLLLMSNPAVAQSGLGAIKTSQLSDQQIMLLWQQAQQAGMSENDAMNLLMKKGLDPSEMNSFRKRLDQIQGKSGKAASKAFSNTPKDTVIYIRDSSWIKESPTPPRKKLELYGSDFFSAANTSFQPNIRVTTPRNYVLGTDDELSITVSGLNEASFETRVTPEGYIQIPYTGPISIAGLTIDQATERIRIKLAERVYPGLKTGASKIFLTLSKVRSIRIMVVGEAARPGTFVVSSLASFFNVLYSCGGPSPLGSLRNIELIRNNKVVETIDFYSFLQKGILEKNIRLEDQDVIRFPLYQKKVHLNGEVKRPAIYELKGNETLADLLRYSGGLSEYAIKDIAKIEQTGDKEMRVRDIQSVDFGNFIPRNADSVYFQRIASRYGNRVIISGAVNLPGVYELTDDLSLAKLIRKADGVVDGAFTDRGYIKRRNKEGDRSLLSFNPAAVLKGTEKDITLMREDSVYLLTRDNLTDIPTITVGGDVRNPIVIQYREGMTVEDALIMAGGFTIDAANHKVEISRLQKNKADTLANQLIEILRINVDSTLKPGMQKNLLQPLDYVFVPKLLNYRNLGSVKIRGEVLYDGDYALEKRNETVQELIQRAGGISPLASMNDVQVYRNGLRVATTLLSDDAKDNKPFLLLPDDSIYIPKRDLFVEVKGEVFNPQILSYDSGSFLSYISESGGVTDKGNLKKAYIQYSNGINKKIRHFLFIRNYPKVLPGSKIIVPEKPENYKRGLSIIEIASLTGSLSALVGLISVLKN